MTCCKLPCGQTLVKLLLRAALKAAGGPAAAPKANTQRQFCIQLSQRQGQITASGDRHGAAARKCAAAARAAALSAPARQHAAGARAGQGHELEA